MHTILRAVAIVLSVAFFALGANALPRFAARTGATCQSCHVNPTGAGMRIAYGAQYGREQLPVPEWSKDFEVEDFTTLLSNFLGVGADVRTLYYYRQVPGGVSKDSSNNAFWEMQGDVYLNFKLAKKVNVYIDKGLYSGLEIFGMLHVLPAAGYVKVGKFVPGYGTRTDDHTSYIRTMTGFSPELGRPEHTGLEAAINPGIFTILGGLYNATEGFGLSGSTKSYLGRAEFRTKIADNFTLGLGGNILATSFSSDVKKTLYGGFGEISFADLTLLGEVDYIANKTSASTITAMALYAEADYPIFTGLDLKLMYDFGDNDIDIKAGSNSRFSVGVEFFPIQGVEVRPVYRLNKESPNDGANNEFDLVLHFYL